MSSSETFVGDCHPKISDLYFLSLNRNEPAVKISLTQRRKIAKRERNKEILGFFASLREIFIGIGGLPPVMPALKIDEDGRPETEIDRKPSSVPGPRSFSSVSGQASPQVDCSNIHNSIHNKDPMFFRQIFEPRLAQYSYFLGCQATGEALVIDPLRDIGQYMRLAEQENFRIAYVTETHIHADFLSGARTLAQASGATLLLSDEGGEDWQYAFPHQGLRDDDDFMVGNIRVQALHTPGHTPEHLSFLITDTAAGDTPGMILTGDFVFVGDVGRPDLLDLTSDDPGVSERMARRLFASLQKFRALPDHILLWPGHGAGSACGRALGAAPTSTVGYEKLTNWALRETDEEAFVVRVLSEQPETPRYFRNMKLWNRSGEKAGGQPPRLRRLSIQRLEALRTQGAKVVDVRDKLAFAEGHIPGSINIPDNELFTTWAGWILEPDQPFVLIAPEERVPDLATSLFRVGVDGAAGYFTDVHYWARMGHELAQLPQMNARELAEALSAKTAVAVDVREPYELHTGVIPGAITAPAGRLVERAFEPDTGRRLVFYCGRGDRSAIVASYLMHLGFSNVTSLQEGIFGWRAAGLEVELPAENADQFEVIDVGEALQRFAMQKWALVDVREPEDFAKGHVPGAINVPLDDFVNDQVVEGLRDKGPLLLICNTGNRSGMAAEWLADEGFEQLANVSGGVVAWQLHHLPWEAP